MEMQINTDNMAATCSSLVVSSKCYLNGLMLSFSCCTPFIISDCYLVLQKTTFLVNYQLNGKLGKHEKVQHINILCISLIARFVFNEKFG